MSKKLHLAGYLNPSPTLHSDASWKHPRASQKYPDPKIYQDVARTLERGFFDFVFFADVLSAPLRYGDSIKPAVEKGVQFVASLDPSYIALTMANVTRHLGLGVTRTTTYGHPFDLARSFATLDHLTEGRIAWNVVTSVSNSEAQNYGVERLLDHSVRYERAHEFLEAAFKLWSSWEPDALILDKEKGIFADPEKVHPVNFNGKWFKTRGPLTVPHSPQGRPAIMQAGSSDRGRDFAAKWAEVVFLIDPTEEGRRKHYKDVKSRLAAAGRDPEGTKIFPAFIPFIGETESIAREKQAFHNSLVDPVAGLIGLAIQLDVDFSKYSLDEPFENVPDAGGIQGMLNIARKLSKKDNLTIGDVGRLYGEGTLLPQIAGTPKQIADHLEHYFKDEQGDGFIISPAYLPGSFQEFTDFVVPELQHRGLLRTRYESTTLRENLGLSPKADLSR